MEGGRDGAEEEHLVCGALGARGVGGRESRGHVAVHILRGSSGMKVLGAIKNGSCYYAGTACLDDAPVGTGTPVLLRKGRKGI